MSEVTTTPSTEVEQPSIDDAIAAKFGLTEPEPEGEASESSDEPLTDEPTPEELEGDQEQEDQPVVEYEDLKHNGQIKRVSKEEARNLAQKGFDYEHNMTEVKAERQRLQGVATAQAAQANLAVQLVDHVADIKMLQRQLAPYAQVDWVQFSQQDPTAAFQQRQYFDSLMNGYNQAVNKLNSVSQQQQQVEQVISSDQLQYESQRLLEALPHWKDEKRSTAERQGIYADLTSRFKPEELKAWAPLFNDHRVIGFMHDGYKYRQAMNARQAKEGQTKGLPQMPRPGARQSAPTKGENIAEITKQLRQAKSPATSKVLQDRLIAAKFGIK